MKELSLNILDITENSVKAKATEIAITISESEKKLGIVITDNGTGMTDEILESVTNPFCTTRTTRKVGMGVPLFRFAAEQTGGSFEITSKHIDTYPILFYLTIISATARPLFLKKLLYSTKSI